MTAYPSQGKGRLTTSGASVAPSLPWYAAGTVKVRRSSLCIKM